MVCKRRDAAFSRSLEVIFGTRDKNRTRKRELKGRAGVGFWEAIISNFSFIGGDYSKEAIKTIN